ncbi:serpin family protein [Youxingia wuxianensis]|uniref:Serpin family protein n=1 Tax=Youxingia wuxianensis TaxID=2763678 RepID=A0A926EKG9_9FIRM|nr:serpin family protein [Youxingia wuxianensis]MBC8584030.1 serpin family protein [Youxingia wuxianensis]
MKYRKLILGILCVSLVMGSCASPEAAPVKPDASSQENSSLSSQPEPATTAVLSDTTGYLTDNEVVENLSATGVNSVNKFGYGLYNKLFKEDENVFVSPVSMYLAFGMLQNGARGETEEQLGAILGGNKLEDLNAFCRDLQLYLINNRDSTELSVGNSLWIRTQEAKTVQQSFIDALSQYYGAKEAALDFDDPAAADTINNWVKESTNGMIEKLIDGPVNKSTVMYLINTIYFKGVWEDAFDASLTKEKDFAAASGTIQVPMMVKSAQYRYVENDQLQGILLPYKDGKTSMLVLLPKGDFAQFAKGITNEQITSLLGKMTFSEVVLSLPKMDIDYSADMIEAMQALGITDLFDKSADLSGINGEKNLYVNKVTHKTVLKVDEEGTEAAGATGIGIAMKAAVPTQQIIMTVDRPFFTAIVDNETGLTLFGGSIVNPQA